MTGCERSQNGDANQFRGAQNSAAQILDGGPDNGIPEDGRPDHGADAGDHVPFLEHPLHDEGVDDEDQSRESLLEPDRRMGMIMPAIRAFRPVIVLVVMRMIV